MKGSSLRAEDYYDMKIPEVFFEKGIDSFEKILWIIENSYDGFVLSDKNGNIFYANRAVERIIGAKREILYQKNVKDFLKQGLIINDKKSFNKNIINMSHRTKTGVEVFITSVGVHDKEGNFLCYVANYREIAELNDIKRQLEKTRAEKNSYYMELKELRNKFLNLEEIVVKSKEMKLLLENIARFAPTDAPVLITGESGVGKGVIAKLIHKMSNRCDGPFIQINCGAIPETLLEAELFGYKKGAFTGANTKGKPGLFEMAQKGTILLDEIAELPLKLQVKLLKVIQDREIYPLGTTRPLKLDVRIICATNRNIEKMVEDGTFRKDLYYRINVIPVKIPPLRKRIEDIIPLACHFLEKFSKKYNKNKSLSPDVWSVLQNYPWPGNVRELENLIERLVVILDREKIYPQDLPPEISVKTTANNYLNLPLKEAKKILEMDIIRQTLKNSQSIRKAAKKLGINHSTLIKKMKNYGITGISG